MANAPNELQEVLIVRVTPQFLERGSLWFSENISSIKKSRPASVFWKNASIILERGLVIRPSEALRAIADLGYEKTGRILGKGEFVWHGNILEIWPINSEFPVRVEFLGNAVESICPFERQALGAVPKISFRTSIEKLPAGSFIVHIDHGIGIFRGIITEEKTPSEPATPNSESSAGNRKRFFVIEYAPPKSGAEPDRLLVPVEQVKRLSAYIGFDTPSIHRLGGTVWFAARRKAKGVAEHLAKELYELYKKRASSKIERRKIEKRAYNEFDEAFAYEETPDQKTAAQDIDRDLELERPMDRIICGDVGFGKTELAMRAAFRTTLTGKQTAVIAPTTILADQHLQNFTERFAESGAIISGLSRLTRPKEEKETIKKIAEGKIDIIIGTHRLLSRDVTFKNLGLVIIDEEQKFGVRQKERFKNMRNSVDMLSLSATPIPRTMALALGGFRDISIIKTPPPGRIPTKTFVLPYSDKVVGAAIAHESEAGGQVYFLHNRVETLAIFQEKLRLLSPAAEIRSIHGRMREKELIAVMRDFRDKKFAVLLATTIIENGLDLPNVNTLIVEDAARLGLAQAHQLRGRIGRGNRASYAYFLYPVRKFSRSDGAENDFARQKNEITRAGVRKFSDLGSHPSPLTEKALERLTALEEYSEFGAGYEIALRDLEIRGAGNVFGKEQSGAINKVGFNLYCQILNEAFEELRETTEI